MVDVAADWIIGDPLALGLDLRVGPEGGDGGGEIVAAGTPEDIVKVKRSYTGAFLKPVLARSRRSQERGGEEAEEAE